jgi:C-terminal processing protease CtpA/Prc
MTRRGVVLLVGLLLAAGPGRAGAADPPRGEDRGTFLGALFSPVPEARHGQRPRQSGVLVTHVLPDSPAAQADLRRDDVLLRYDGEVIRDCEHLARLIQRDRPGRTVRLALLRDGRETTTPVTLGLGPALRIAPAPPRPGAGEPAVPRGVAKPGGPATVSVAATPLDNGAMQVTIEYYHDATGRIHSLTCKGSEGQIDVEVAKQLPQREGNLVRSALQRIRALNSSKAAERRAVSKP